MISTRVLSQPIVFHWDDCMQSSTFKKEIVVDNMANKGLYTLAEESRERWNILVLTFREASFMIQE